MKWPIAGHIMRTIDKTNHSTKVSISLGIVRVKANLIPQEWNLRRDIYVLQAKTSIKALEKK